MEYTEHYDNWEQRNSLCDTAEGNGFRMLHDTFDPDWQKGDEPHGTLTFTDEPSLPPEPSPLELLATEVDEIKGKMVVSEPPTGMKVIKNIYKDPETDEMVGEEENG